MSALWWEKTAPLNCAIVQAPAVLCNEKLTSAVRKDLATALRDLMQHGLMEVSETLSQLPSTSNRLAMKVANVA